MAGLSSAALAKPLPEFERGMVLNVELALMPPSRLLMLAGRLSEVLARLRFKPKSGHAGSQALIAGDSAGAPWLPDDPSGLKLRCGWCVSRAGIG
jgi:hypothetical protein